MKVVIIRNFSANNELEWTARFDNSAGADTIVRPIKGKSDNARSYKLKEVSEEANLKKKNVVRTSVIVVNICIKDRQHFAKICQCDLAETEP